MAHMKVTVSLQGDSLSVK